jgi:hypothetical protein
MSTDLSDLMAQDSQSPLNLPSNQGLGGVQKLANDILAAQTRVENLEADLKAAKQTLLKLTDEDLPSQMTEIGMTNFTLADGSKVDIKETYGARIKKDNEEKAFDWLRAHGEADIIKNTVTVRFGKEKEDIHPGTLKAWVKGRIEEGKELDMDLFGVWVGQRATITKAK